MKVVSIEAEGASVEFSVEELDAIRNALNEAPLLLKGRDGHEFATRIGMPVEDAAVLIKALQALITQIGAESRSLGAVAQQVKRTG